MLIEFFIANCDFQPRNFCIHEMAIETTTINASQFLETREIFFFLKMFLKIFGICFWKSWNQYPNLSHEMRGSHFLKSRNAVIPCTHTFDSGGFSLGCSGPQCTGTVHRLAKYISWPGLAWFGSEITLHWNRGLLALK